MYRLSDGPNQVTDLVEYAEYHIRVLPKDRKVGFTFTILPPPLPEVEKESRKFIRNIYGARELVKPLWDAILESVAAGQAKHPQTGIAIERAELFYGGHLNGAKTECDGGQLLQEYDEAFGLKVHWDPEPEFWNPVVDDDLPETEEPEAVEMDIEPVYATVSGTPSAGPLEEVATVAAKPKRTRKPKAAPIVE